MRCLELREYVPSLDDLHLTATGEFADDELALEILNGVYETAEEMYFAVVERLRQLRERSAS